MRDAPAVHEFHEDVLAAVGKRSGVGYRADVGTPQARRGAAFLKEAVRDGLVCRGIGQERLQREVLVEAEVRDLVHNAHASAADQPDNADRMERLGAGIGLSVGQFTPERVAKELQRLLAEPGFKEAAKGFQMSADVDVLMRWIEERA